MQLKLQSVALGLLSCLPLVVSAPSPSMPRVDLGYEIHEAYSFNDSGRFYNFSNIRYGREPIGNLRFSAPEKPLVNRTSIQKGDVGRICTQAFPAWYIAGKAMREGDMDTAEQAIQDPLSVMPPPEPRETEDCLFLDVVVPESVIAKRENKAFAGAPVMVWFYGGGFTFTDLSSGTPAGLIERSREGYGSDDGVIYVYVNYRGGAFGFLSGPELQANGTANAGLLDQRLSLEWVQEHISKFGGNPSRVTLFGQSAGGGSIMHQITAYGGLKGKVPFQQAILQSPGFQPYPGNYQQTTLLHEYLSALNVSTVHEARQLPYEELRAANTALVAKSPIGQFTFSPTVDGSFVPALPGQLLLQGDFDSSLRVMTGHNFHETLNFMDPNATSDADFHRNLKSSFPAIQDSVVEYVADTLYPVVEDIPEGDPDELGYTDARGRFELCTSEISFTCNTNFVAKAFADLHGEETYSYRFSVLPGGHGQDGAYTYFNGPSEGVDSEIALAMQTYFTQFTITGQPNKDGYPAFPPYGSNATMLNLSPKGISAIHDDTDNARCNWWQQGLYF